jgi:glutaredoxin-like protein NrdH
MTITVFSKPDCVQCDRTKIYLDKKNLPYEEVDITDTENHPGALNFVKDELGFLQAPVVLVSDADWNEISGADIPFENRWSGFRPDALAGLAKKVDNVSAVKELIAA